MQVPSQCLNVVQSVGEKSTCWMTTELKKKKVSQEPVPQDNTDFGILIVVNKLFWPLSVILLTLYSLGSPDVCDFAESFNCSSSF